MPAAPQSQALRKSHEFWDLVLVSADDPRKRLHVTLAALTVLLLVGWIDASTKLPFGFFYTIPILLIVSARGWRWGLGFALTSSFLSYYSDRSIVIEAFTHLNIIWNVGFRFIIYSLNVALYHSLLLLHRELEERVAQRTLALTAEINERRRLEREIMDTSQRERAAMGHDLHDGICQHLTGTALATRVLVEQLEQEKSGHAEDAQQIVNLIEQGIGQTRRLAKGLLLVSVEEEGLVVALEELALSASELFHMNCELRRVGVVPAVRDIVTASHIYHIAQEAIRNAARHGKARHVVLELCGKENGLELTISDDGRGLPLDGPRGRGMGLRIMAHRAANIGAQFTIAPAYEGGTTIRLNWTPKGVPA